MAGMETIHRVVEKIEVAGEKQAEHAFDKLGGVVGKVAAMMGLIPKKSEHAMHEAGKHAENLGEKLEEAGHKGGESGHEGKEGFKGLAEEITKGEIGAHLFEKALDFVVDKVKEFIHEGYELNERLEEMHDRTTGLILTMSKWKDEMDGMERFEASSRAANAILDEFKDTAKKTATPLEQIATLAEQIEPIWTALGKSQYDVAKATDSAAAAAKVLGISTDHVFASMQRIIETGKAGRRDDIGRLLVAQAHIKTTDSMAVRAEKLNKAMEKVAEPIKEITKGTGHAVERLKIMSEDVLQRLTLPIFEKVGVVVSKIVDLLDKNSDVIDEIVSDVWDWFEVTWDLLANIGDIVKQVWDLDDGSKKVKNAWDLVWGSAKLTFKVIDLIADGVGMIGELMHTLTDPHEGFEKLGLLAQSFFVKLMKIIDAIDDMIAKLANIAIPDWVVNKVPGAGAVKGFFDNIRKEQKETISEWERKIAEREKALGMGPTTELGRKERLREEGLGLSKKDREKLLKSIFGEKRPLIEIDKVEIRQDFRDQDPDRVLVEFTRGLERLGENALQSSVGGRATVFGPGGSY